MSNDGGLRRRLALGFGAQGLQLAVRLTQQIILVPLLINAWGTPVYQDWIVLFAAASLVPLLELGTQAYFGNTMLACWAADDRPAFKRALHIALGVQVTIVGVALLASAALSMVFSWVPLIGVSSLRPGESETVLLLLSLANLATVPQGVMTTIYRARGDFSRYVNVTTLLIGFETGGMAAAVLLGGSPTATASVYAAAVALTWTLLIVDQRRRYRDLSYLPRWPDRGELKHLVATAPFHFVNNATTTVVTNGPILLLQLVAPSAAIVSYSASRLVVGILRQLTHQMAHACGVEMARQFIQRQGQELRRLFQQTGHLAGLLFGLLGGALLVVAGPFFHIWTQGKVSFDPVLFALLVGNIFLILPGQPALTMLFYSNQPRPLSLAYAGHVVGGLTLLAVLSPALGASGAALGMGLAEFVTVGLWLTQRCAREAGVPLGAHLISTYASAVASFGVGYGVARLVGRVIVLKTFGDLIVFGLVWGGLIAIPAMLIVLARWQGRRAMALLFRQIWRSA